MNTKAYYNEFDPKAAAWLKELIKNNLIADGDVDDRDIQDIKPSELRGYTQCHFFAGIGVWSYALRLAGWPDNEPVWTGSCPCQPFSQAGKGKGFIDERHLWPSWQWLIQQCKPNTIFGEQVASRDGLSWLDLVQTDLEGMGYTCGAINLPACGIGAPHLRQRTWWVSEALANPNSSTTWRNSRTIYREKEKGNQKRLQDGLEPNGFRFCGTNGVAQGDTNSERSQGWEIKGNSPDQQSTGSPGLVNGFWSNAEWLPCTDGKLRPVEPGTFPLVDGTPERVGLLRGYGNAINAQAAKAFIEAYLTK